MKRKIFAVFTALAMAISLLPNFSVFAETTYTGTKCDDTPLYYEAYYDTYYVVDCEKDATSIVIPESVNGCPVTKIMGSAFADCTQLESVTIPESVTYILNNAFEGCTALTSVNIPEGITTINMETFKDCTSLTSITLHDKITEILSNAFLNTGYYNDTSNWENGVLYIGKYLIAADEKSDVLENCTIKNGTKLIAYGTFKGNDKIKKLTIPQSVEIIQREAFEYCIELSDITIFAENIAIGKNAFYKTGFYENSENWESDVLYIGKHLVGANSSATADIKVKDGTLTIADRVFTDNANITSVSFPAGLIRIGDYAFKGCTKLKDVVIPESVLDIDSNAFAGCTSIESAKINNEIVGQGMFSDCTALANVTFGDKVKSIGYEAFYNCAIESITIPENVVEIATNAFRQCSKLKNISILNDNMNIGNYAFSGCSALTDINFLPETITSIGYGWFTGCKGLTSLTIPERITGIEDNAFKNCSKLTDIKLHSGITSIGTNAFYGCGFSSITLPSGLKTISNGLFLLCKSLNSVNIPHGVTSIEKNAFNQCQSLTSLYIPKSVTSIGFMAIRLCSSLTEINYGGTQEEWNAITIDESNSLNNVTINYNCVPKTTTTVNENTFTVTGDYIDGCTVILALYKEDGQGGSQLVEYQTAEYSGSEKTFTTTATDYTSVKVMVWNNFETIVPVTEVENVNLGQSN